MLIWAGFWGVIVSIRSMRFGTKNGGWEFRVCVCTLDFGLKMGVGGVEKCFKV